jgi:hypothetical protein
LVKHTQEAWCNIGQSYSSPFPWYGKYYKSEPHLLRALVLNPADDRVRETALNGWIDRLYFAEYHLPDLYIGEPAFALGFAEKMKAHIPHLTTPERRNYWTEELNAYLELINNYTDWQASGHLNFNQWGHEHKKCTSLAMTATYYFEKKALLRYKLI